MFDPRDIRTFDTPKEMQVVTLNTYHGLGCETLNKNARKGMINQENMFFGESKKMRKVI